MLTTLFSLHRVGLSFVLALLCYSKLCILIYYCQKYQCEIICVNSLSVCSDVFQEMSL